MFVEEMEYLKKNNIKVITLKSLISHMENKVPFKDKVCVITIDDGFMSTYKVAFPVLKKYNYPATLFIYTGGFIDNWPAALTWDQIQDMMKYNIDIQSHSVSHPLLTKMKKGETYKNYLNRIKWELIASKKYLEQKLNSPVEYFAYPYGGYNKRVEKLCKQAGYKALLNVDLGLSHVTDSPYHVKRITILPEYKLTIFEKLIQKRGFLVLFE